MKLLSSHHPVTIAAGSLVAIVSIAAIAQAATDTIYRYATPRTGILSISAMALSPEKDDADYQLDPFDGSARNITGLSCLLAPVNLPQGATVTGVTGFFASGNMPDNPGYALVRHPYGSGPLSPMAERVFLDDTNTVKALKSGIAAGTEIVNNNLFNYSFAACLGSADNKFYGAKITYTYTHAGD